MVTFHALFIHDSVNFDVSEFWGAYPQNQDTDKEYKQESVNEKMFELLRLTAIAPALVDVELQRLKTWPACTKRGGSAAIDDCFTPISGRKAVDKVVLETGP